jgi:hypothetical protein
MKHVRALAGRALRAYGGWPIHLVLATLLVPGAVFLGEALFDRDLHLDWYPRALVFAHTIRAGFLPLWDLTIGFGQPLLADPGAQVLYPTTWLAVLLAPWTVYTIFVVFHLTFSAVGFTRLARALGLRQPEAVAAGAAWMLSGPFVSLVNLWHHLAGAAWMPWVVLAAHRVVRRPTPSRVAAFAVCLAFQVLAGSGDMLLLTAGVVAAWLVATGPRWRRLVGAAVPLTLGVVVAAGLSAVQWVPTVELASRALRRELPRDVAVEWSVPPAGLVRTIVPLDSSGRVAYSGDAWKALFEGHRQPFFGSLYLGVVALTLAVAALTTRRRRRPAVVLAGAAGIALAISMGGHTPLYGLVVRLVPPAAHLRYPTKVTLVAAFAVAMLAGLGLRSLRAKVGGRGVVFLFAVAGAVVLVAAAVLFGPGLRLAVAWDLLRERTGMEGDALPSMVRLLDHGLVALLAGIAVLRAAPRSRWPRFVAAACMAGDLLLAHYDLHSTAPTGLLTLTPPVLSAIDTRNHARTYVYEYEILRGASERLLGRPSPYTVAQPLPGIDPRPLAALAMRVYPVPPCLGYWGVEGSYDLDLRGLQPLPLFDMNLLLRKEEGTPAHRRLLALGAVRTVVALHEAGFGDLVPGPTFSSLFGERIRTFRVPDALPRAYAVGRARVVPEDRALAAVVDPSFDPAREVVLSGPRVPPASPEWAPSAEGKVRIEELFADRERLAADLPAAGYVVSVDAWDPGWRALVDGKATPVLRANAVFRAVAVPAGRHVVEMRYRPPAVAAGLALTVVTLLASAGTLLLLRRRRRSVASAREKRPAPPSAEPSD